METPRKVLLTTLKDLRENEFKEFKSHLEEKVLGFPRIPKSELEKAADRLDTRDLMFLYYGIHTIKVTTAVLKEIPRNDLVEELSKIPSDPEGRLISLDYAHCSEFTLKSYYMETAVQSKHQNHWPPGSREDNDGPFMDLVLTEISHQLLNVLR
ncbi:hypothetical protein KUCAC02_031780 [Chaenocephalus aceratus]|nr:hypothetical protein KUCAC02_031780 [Chaenocephalus aceratus]